VTRPAIILLAAAASLAACSGSDSNCEPCAALGNTCVPPGACTPASCERPIVTSALPAAQVQAFGVHKVGTQVTFTVPPDAGSVTIVQQAKVAGLNVVYRNQVLDNSAVPLTVTFPNGQLAYDDNVDAGTPSPDGGEDPSGQYAFYGGGTPNTGAFTIPNTSRSLDGGIPAIPAGSWKFVVNDYAYECAAVVSGCNDGGSTDSEYDVTVVTRPLPSGNVMDVAFYIVGDVQTLSGAPLRAANAPNDPNVKRMVQTFTSLMAGAGIAVNVQFFDVSDAARTRFGEGNLNVDSTGPCDEMNQMFTLSSVNAGNHMNLFLVRGITATTTSGGEQVVGVDGTIPGPSSFNGTVQSGAVVSMADVFATSSRSCPIGPYDLCQSGADEVAFIAAHETGHFLGLFHTTEREGADFDPLSDTRKCPCTACASTTDRPKCGNYGTNSPTLLPNQCVSAAGGSCGGGDNLMFWFLQPGVSAGTLTAQQAQVMGFNPLVHP
jgi:hypothetical protein